jgi:hypothetical protein
MFLKVSTSKPEDLQLCRTQAEAALSAVEALDRFSKGEYVAKAAPSTPPPAAHNAIKAKEPLDPLDMLAALPSVPSGTPSQSVGTPAAAPGRSIITSLSPSSSSPSRSIEPEAHCRRGRGAAVHLAHQRQSLPSLLSARPG